MKFNVLLLLILCYFLIIFSCRKPYNPVIVSTDQSYLVVDGLINSGSDSTIIYLSRTVKLNSPSFRNDEQGARVTIESDKNDDNNHRNYQHQAFVFICKIRSLDCCKLFDASKCAIGENTINIQLKEAYKLCKTKHL